MKNEDNDIGKNPLMDAVQLEIEMEKKKIREEVIASEFLKRQELEVKMELMMDKPIMESSDGDFGEKLKVIDPAISGVDDLQQIDSDPAESDVFGDGEKEQQIQCVAIGKQPFERNPDLVVAHIAGKSVGDFDGEEVLGQAIPSSGSISGTKRKAETSVPCDEEPVIVANKELQKKKWYCSLCDVSATSAGGWNLHIHGKKHKAKEASSTPCKAASNIITVSYSTDNSLHPMEQAKAQAQPTEGQPAQAQPMEEPKAQVHPMEDENIQVHPMEEDKSQAQPMEEDESQVEKEKTQATKKWECSLCQISATSEILLRTHLQGKKHKAKEFKLGLIRGMSEAKGTSEVVHKWFCSLCNVQAASEKNLHDHIQGKKHKTKAGLEDVCVDKSLEGDKGLDDEQAIVNTSESKTGFSRNTSHDEGNKRETKCEKNIETEESEEIGQQVIRELVKVWFCKTCNEETNDEAEMANHRKSSKHMTKLRKNGGGVIVVSSMLKKAVEGEKGSSSEALECK